MPPHSKICAFSGDAAASSALFGSAVADRSLGGGSAEPGEGEHFDALLGHANTDEAEAAPGLGLAGGPCVETAGRDAVAVDAFIADG